MMLALKYDRIGFSLTVLWLIVFVFFLRLELMAYPENLRFELLRNEARRLFLSPPFFWSSVVLAGHALLRLIGLRSKPPVRERLYFLGIVVGYVAGLFSLLK